MIFTGRDVIPKPRVLTSGARNLAWKVLAAAREIPFDSLRSLRAGSSLRLKSGCAQDDASFLISMSHYDESDVLDMLMPSMNASITFKTILTRFVPRPPSLAEAKPASDRVDLKRQKFEAAMFPYFDAAYNLARWITGNAREATHVVEDSYQRAFREFDGCQSDEIKMWLLSLVRNTAHARLQRHKVMASAEHSQSEQALMGDRNGLRRLIEELPPEFREVFVMRELEQMSYREIAAVCGLSSETVASRLATARDRLIRHCPPQYDKPREPKYARNSAIV